jgi:hypothetical protein
MNIWNWNGSTSMAYSVKPRRRTRWSFVVMFLKRNWLGRIWRQFFTRVIMIFLHGCDLFVPAMCYRIETERHSQVLAPINVGQSWGMIMHEVKISPTPIAVNGSVNTEFWHITDYTAMLSCTLAALFLECVYFDAVIV